MPDDYHAGQRSLQDRFDSRRIADRLVEHTYRSELTEDDRAFIGAARMFFLATADADGHPDVSFKGGAPGFVRGLSSTEIAWPDYDGNGQFRSLGNVAIRASVALLFIDFERPRRLRVHGDAALCFEDPLLSDMPGAQLVVRLHVTRVFPNCPRYLPTLAPVADSPYLPRCDEEPPVPGWKKDARFADALPDRKDR